MQNNDDKQKTLFGYPVVEVEMKDIPENPKIVLGDMSAYVTWRIRKRRPTKRAPDAAKAARKKSSIGGKRSASTPRR